MLISILEPPSHAALSRPGGDGGLPRPRQRQPQLPGVPAGGAGRGAAGGGAAAGGARDGGQRGGAAAEHDARPGPHRPQHHLPAAGEERCWEPGCGVQCSVCSNVLMFLSGL